MVCPLASLVGHVCVKNGSSTVDVSSNTTVIVLSYNIFGDAERWPMHSDPTFEARLLDALSKGVPGWRNATDLYLSTVRPDDFMMGRFVLLDYAGCLWHMNVFAKKPTLDERGQLMHLLGGTVVMHAEPGGHGHTWLLIEDAVIDAARCNPPVSPSAIRQSVADRNAEWRVRDLCVTTFTPELLLCARANPGIVRILVDKGPGEQPSVASVADMPHPVDLGIYTLDPLLTSVQPR